MKIRVTFTVFFLLTSLLFSQGRNEYLKISPLTGDFYIFTTWKDYKGTLFPANGLYLVTESGVVMVDTPWDSTQFQPLLDSIKIKHNKNVVMCIATHSHEDRTGGLEYYKQKGIQTFTTAATDKICKMKKENRAEFVITKDSIFKVGRYSFQTYFAGQGHTPDNIVIWFEKDKILYGGCLVKSMEANDLGNLADANTSEWPTTIKNIQEKFGKPDHTIPGHHSWASNKSLKHTLKLLKQYERKNDPA